MQNMNPNLDTRQIHLKDSFFCFNFSNDARPGDSSAKAFLSSHKKLKYGCDVWKCVCVSNEKIKLFENNK